MELYFFWACNSVMKLQSEQVENLQNNLTLLNNLKAKVVLNEENGKKNHLFDNTKAELG